MKEIDSRFNVKIDEELHPYGDHYRSYKELIQEVSRRKGQNVKNLRGAAIVFIDNGDKIDRISVRVMPDGELNFAHAEWF